MDEIIWGCHQMLQSNLGLQAVRQEREITFNYYEISNQMSNEIDKSRSKLSLIKNWFSCTKSLSTAFYLKFVCSLNFKQQKLKNLKWPLCDHSPVAICSDSTMCMSINSSNQFVWFSTDLIFGEFCLFYRNLDSLTETYGLSFYMQYLAHWPEYFQVAESPSGEIMGYSMYCIAFNQPIYNVFCMWLILKHCL